MFSLYVLIGFLLITSVFCSESGSNDDSNDSDDKSNSSEEQEQCPCVPSFHDADFEEFAGFWYIVGISDDFFRCARVVNRNNYTGIQVTTVVSEFIGVTTKVIEKGLRYKINKAKHLLIISNFVMIATVLDADYDRDEGYVLIHYCEARNSSNQQVVLFSRQPEVPDLNKLNKNFRLLSHHSSEDSDSSDKSSDLSDTDDELDINLSQYGLDYITVYKVQHDDNCKYVYDDNI